MLDVAPVDSLAHQVEDGRAARQNDAGGEYGALAYDRPFVDTAVPPDEHVVFDDDRSRTHRFEHATDLRAGAEMHPRADLRTGANERVRVDHRVGADIRADIDVDRRHADDARRDVRTATDGGVAGNDQDAVRHGEARRRAGGS